MKLLIKTMFVSIVILAVSANAMDQDTQVDILMSKVTKALKEHRYSDVIPAMEKLESIQASLNQPLSEGFEFFYIDALEKSKKYFKALTRANSYLDKFGKKGEHYNNIIELIADLEDKQSVWLDKKTNLMWQDDVDAQTITKNWRGAIDYCNDLVLEGYDDWRLPDRNTLEALYPKMSNLKKFNGQYYWESTSDTSDDGIFRADALDYKYNGLPMGLFPKDYNHVRCVRDNK